MEDNSQFNKDFIKNYNKESDEKCFPEVNIQYPEQLHDLPLQLHDLPEKNENSKIRKIS